MSSASAAQAACIDPLVSVLEELAAVVRRLDDGHYVQAPVGVISSSLGSHVRHCLDHVKAVLVGGREGRLDYDHRERGTPVESSRQAALDEINRLLTGLHGLQTGPAQQDLVMRILLTRDGQPVQVRTTLDRELSYVLAHTIHHNALISAMLKTLGAWQPETFGYAPATLKHELNASCVRSA